MEYNNYAAIISTDITISSGATASTAVTTGGVPIDAVLLSTAITGTALALHGSMDGGVTFSAVRDAETDAAVSVTATAGGIVSNLARYTQGLDAVKFVSSGAEAADRTLTVKSAVV